MRIRRLVPVALVVLLAVGLAAFTYLGLERLGRRGWVPLAFRAVAWARSQVRRRASVVSESFVVA
jgi:hypothetical protein